MTYYHPTTGYCFIMGVFMVNLIVADDHAIVRQALCELLENRGDFNVVAQAEDGEQLLELLKSDQHPDLIIMDACMPRLDGVETLKAMEAQFKHDQMPPVLILSANDKGKYVSAALHAGAKGFIPKNADTEELLFAISSVLKGKTYLSPEVIAPLMAEREPLENSPLSVLTKRELEITKHLANGMSNREIGEKLHISIRTVDTHRSNILRKLKARNNADLVRMAVTYNLITV